MTNPPSATRRWPVIGGVIVIAVVVLGVIGLWYLFLRPSGPAPVSLASAAPAATAAVAPASSSGAGGASGAPAASAATGSASGGIDGTWAVDPSVGSFADFSSAFVGYRVKETLANVGATEAVGRTPNVTGTVTINGTTIPTASFEADLSTLQSDNNMRDGQLNRQALETGQYPKATFTLTKPIDLGSVPADGATVEATATGDLTLHGTTKSVDIPLQARLSGNVITIAGSLPITFADFGITKPQSMMVLSVEDHGVMELQLQLTKAQG